jgi:hypothetical protein
LRLLDRARKIVVLAVSAGCVATASSNAAQVPNPGLRGTAIGVYRPATSEFFGRDQRPGFDDDRYDPFRFAFGLRGSVPVVGDWDGNGSQTVGVFRAGAWSLAGTLAPAGGWLAGALGNPHGAVAVSFGEAGDRPLVGDWNGDGTETIGVQRGNRFLLSDRNRSPATTYDFTFGDAGDVAVVGDWDGDGRDSIGVYRSGRWYLRNSNATGAADATVAYGAPDATPVVGDWDSDGRVGIGVYAHGVWRLSNSVTAPSTDISVEYGRPTDRPLVGNWGSTSQLFGSTPPELRGFFPIAVDFQPPSSLRTWRRRGINTAIRVPHGTGIERWTRAADAAGLKMIREPGPDPARDEHDPNLLAFTGPDEPEQNGCTPDCVLAVRHRLKAAAPTKPYLLNLGGLAVAYPGAPQDGRACNGPGDDQGDPQCVAGYIAAADWVSHDVYPVNQGVPLDTIGNALDRLRRWSQRRPQFAYIEASDYNGDGRRPTAEELRAEIWDAIIHGARGIAYFVVDARHPIERPDAVPPDLLREMEAQNARITGLADVLQTPVNPSQIAVRAPSPIEYTWRRVGSETFAIALNRSAAPVTAATMSLLGVDVPPSVAVRGEHRTLATSGNHFTDAFGPYEVHVYRL